MGELAGGRPSGLLVVDKPRGPTSHDVVAMVRRALRTRAVGHAGTLDPMATGVLVLALGEATKLVPYLTDAAKEYEARLALGQATDTLDAMGKVVAEQAVDEELVGSRMAQALADELARTMQVPPAFSAIHHEGERAYALARRGEEVVLDARAVRVHRLVVTGRAAGWIDLRVRADKGYYVRSLGRDLAHALGTVGHLTALRRIDSGGFVADEATPLACPRDELESRVLPLAVAARRALPSATLTDAGVKAARFGQRVAPSDFESGALRGEPSAWFDGAGDLVAVGILDEDGRVLRGFGL